MTDLFSDHSNLSDLTQVTQQTDLTQVSRYGVSQQFWATPSRSAQDSSVEVLEIAIVGEQLINWLQFDVSKYPNTCILEYWDATLALWTPLLDPTNTPIQLSMHASVPAVIPPPSNMTGRSHPQHDFIGHWQTIDVVTRPIRTRKIRMKFRRVSSDVGPRNVYGTPVDYSLAVRGTSFGYRVTSREDVPRTLPQSDNTRYRTGFASTLDPLSSQTSFALRELRASGIVGEGESDVVWRCEPMPDPNCVVNLYADMRDAQGKAQVIDRIFLDPIVNGVHVSLYYANEMPSTGFVSSDDPVPSSAISATSGVKVDSNGLHFASAMNQDTYDFSNGNSYQLNSLFASNVVLTLTGQSTTYVLGTDYTLSTDNNGVTTVTRLDSGSIPNSPDTADTPNPGVTITYTTQQSLVLRNSRFGYDVTAPWWVAMTVVPQFDQAVDVLSPPDQGDSDTPAPPVSEPFVRNTFFDCGTWSLCFTAHGVMFQTATGDQIDLTTAYRRGLPSTVFISYDGQQYSLWSSSVLSTDQITMPVSTSLTGQSVTQISLGSNIANTQAGLADITSLVIKQEAPPVDGSDFRDHTQAYTAVTEYSADEDDRSHYNALLRFNPMSELVSPVYPWGLFGMRPNKYDAMTWTPVPNDYTLQRGWLTFSPVLASYWKLEFTHLQAVYADVNQPVSVLVKRFPTSVLADYRQRLQSTAAQTNEVGYEQQETLSTYSAYDDKPVVVSTGGTGLGYTNTEVYVAQDHTTARRLYEAYGETWAYQKWQSAQTAPRFFKTQQHDYSTELVTRKTKIAYVVGLRKINFGRSSFLAEVDTPQYEDLFYDTQNLASSSWLHDDDHQALTSGASNLVTATSNAMLSNRDVRGVQFASHQSPAQEMLDDSEFDDPLFTEWSASGDAHVGPLVRSDVFNNLLLVSRAKRSGTWGDAAGNFVTWGGFPAASATFGSIAQVQGQSSSGSDGIRSVPVDQPQGGYLYGAARVIVDQDLQQPLWLQLYDTVTDSVLAESARSITKGQVAEWFCSYQINSGLVHVAGISWGELAGALNSQPSFIDNFTRPNSSDLGQMQSGQSWDTETEISAASLSIVSNLATVTANYPAQVSRVDTATPFGTLVVKLGAYSPLAHNSTSALPLIKLGGYWFMSDNRIIDSNTGSEVFYSADIVSGDTLRFEFKPTSQLTATENPSSVPSQIRSWAIAVYRNDVYYGSIISSRGYTSIRSLTGPANQSFANFSWVPRRDLPSPAIRLLYRTLPSQLESVQTSVDPNTANQVVTTPDGRSYLYSPSGTFTANYSGYNLGSSNGFTAASSTLATMQTQVNSVEGVLAGSANVLSASSPSTWNLILLDDTNTQQLVVRADGTLILTAKSAGSTTLKTNVWNLAAGSYLAEPYSIAMLAVSKLPPGFAATYNIPSGDTQAIVFMRSENVVSVVTGNNLFSSSTRGISAYSGSSVTGFQWTPILGVIDSVGTGGRTWGQVDNNGQRTWGGVGQSQAKTVRNPVRTRLIQKDTTNDQWYCSSLGIFFDPIVWEFSNDGRVWVPGAEIRNDPRGAVLFPAKTTARANQLYYRVSSYSPNTWVSNVTLRPWYRGSTQDSAVMPPQPLGPNLNPQDSYAAIENDPHWQVWKGPVPREWHFSFQQLLPGIAPPKTHVPVVTERIFL